MYKVLYKELLCRLHIMKEEEMMEKLRISENRRYFVTADGKPFTWIADTNWTIPQRLKWDDVEYLMKKRKSQGFTVLQIVALDPERDMEMHSPSGEKALLNDDPDTPNERYFEYLDWILDKAESYGFYVLLLPVWGQLVVGSDWSGCTYEKTITEENAYRYGRWIGNRYREKNHILWCLGGDRQPIHDGVDYKNVWRRLAEGIAKGVLDQDLKYNQPDDAWKDVLMTYHACHEMQTGECSTMSYWTDEEAWINFIMLQSGHGLTPKNYELVEKEYSRKKVMPVWDGEPAYEMMPTSWPITPETKMHGSWMTRKRAYWSLFSGAFGYTYGHASVWCCVSEQEKSPISSQTWYEALQSEGSEQIRYLRQFSDSLQIMTARPAREILPQTEGEDVLDLHLQACTCLDERFACVYFPSGGGAVLNLGNVWNPEAPREFDGEVCLWWYNPRDGKFYTHAGQRAEAAETAQAAGGKLSVSAPDSGPEHDWVLIASREQTEAPVKEQTYYNMDEEKAVKKVFEW